MSRSHSIALLAFALGAVLALPVVAQQAKPAPAAVQGTPAADSPVPGSEEWQSQYGETTRPAPERRDNSAEVAVTDKLNAEVAARNEAAARAEADIIASNDAAYENWQAETARIAAENARIAAENAAAEDRYRRDMAAYEQSVVACERAGGRNCRANKP